ncbi:MAG: polyprenyl synthetase family protein [Candidatus Moraniibacteriota bacterium]
MEKNAPAVEILKNYKKRLDPYLKEYFAQKLEQAKKIDPLAVQVVEVIEKFVLSGGKRIRPALAYYGYLAAGGKDGEHIVKASMSIELAHAFLLIHDDIIDRDDVRHNTTTVHKIYKNWGEDLSLDEKDASHFGNSMAIVVGDVAYSMANEISFNSDFDAETILMALKKIQEIVYQTIPGEMLDVLMEAKGIATEKEIMRMYEGKTARYTFEGPLHLGAVFAGQKSNKELMKALTDYSLPIGIAFQIRDDILGLFGEENKLGKVVGADIIEGKQTLLIVRALEKGTKEQKKEIKELLGKKDLTLPELEIFRKIIKETGSLEYSQKLSERLIAEALLALKKIEFKNSEARIFLEGIADYIIKREV